MRIDGWLEREREREMNEDTHAVRHLRVCVCAYVCMCVFVIYDGHLTMTSSILSVSVHDFELFHVIYS